MAAKHTFFCITCEFKGGDFLRACKAAGNRVFLITAEKTKDDGWPLEDIDEVYYMPESDGRLWKTEDLIKGLAFLSRDNQISRIIALDDYDVSKASDLREEFRMPGMGQTTARHFFDKLAMRMIADEAGIPIPGYAPLFNNEAISQFLSSSEGPWLVKPRSDAGTLGIRKVHHADEFWAVSDELGEHRHAYLIEEFKPGAVCHVDSLSFHHELLFSRASQYLATPFEVAHGGGIFRSAVVEFDTALDKKLRKLNKHVLKAFGLKHGASHSEFIYHPENDQVVFLETSARVGGANLSEMVEASSGINLWMEWARIESALLNQSEYRLPEIRNQYAGIVQSLSKYEHADYAAFTEPEVCWTLNKPYHVGAIVRSDRRERVIELLDRYAEVVQSDFHAAVPLNE